MSDGFSLIDWALCGFVLLAVLIAIYTHSEGNRVSATRFVYDDIRREMTTTPRRKVWWRAFSIAMGWRTKRNLSTASRR